MPRYANMRLGALLAPLLLVSCASNPLDNKVPAPIENRTTPTAVAANRAPDSRPDSITVAKGDTLYSLALEYGHDYKDLAAWNHLADPNVINVGQQLRLTPPEGDAAPMAAPVAAPAEPVAVAHPLPQPTVVTTPLPAERNLSQPRALMVPYSAHALTDLKIALQATGSVKSAALANVNSLSSADSRLPAKVDAKVILPTQIKPVTVAAASGVSAQTKAVVPVVAKADSKDESAKGGADDDISWQWPTQGKVVMDFRDGASKGIDIAGKKGQAIFSASVGKVVYSGNGLRGYGKLVIIKHNKTYLSAYAHNQTVLVKEGDTVVKGQKIAEMGDTDSDKVELHFEIRRFGKPVDPIKYLPAETS